MTDAPQHIAEPPPAAQAPAVIHLPHLPPPVAAPTRKKATRRRGHVERYRTDEAEHAELERRARDAGLSVNAYSRLRTLGDPGPRARRRAPVDATALMSALMAFNRAHNNLNQIARALNTLVLFAEEHGAGRVLEELENLRRAVEPIERSFAAPTDTTAQRRRPIRRLGISTETPFEHPVGPIRVKWLRRS